MTSFSASLILRFLLFAVSVLALFASHAHAAVWPTTHQWLEPVSAGSKDTWEDSYSQWIATKVDETIFSSPTSPYYGTVTDCADAVYTLRLFFAAQNGLPFIVTSSSGGHISNETTAFDRLPPAQRFKKFVRFVEDATNTSTLSQDTYPVAINRRFVRPGAIMLYNKHHSMTVHGVDQFGVVEFLAATIPASVWKLDVRTAITDGPFGTTSAPVDGLRAWRHHELRIPVTSERGFSIEQFLLPKTPAEAWGQAVQVKLQYLLQDPRSRLELAIENLCDGVRGLRAKVVNEGVAFSKALHKRGRSCMTATEFDTYSTPWRDFGIKTSFATIARFLENYNDSPDGRALAEYADQLMSSCVIRYSLADDEAYTTLFDFRNALENGAVSSNPNDSLETRWGLQSPSARPACPDYTKN